MKLLKKDNQLIMKKELKKQLMLHLDTTDKRVIFLKCCFPDFSIVPYVHVEGIGLDCSHSICQWFERNNMLDSLKSAIDSTFKC